MSLKLSISNKQNSIKKEINVNSWCVWGGGGWEINKDHLYWKAVVKEKSGL